VVRDAGATLPASGDFGVVALVRLLVALWVVGGRRLRHVAFLTIARLKAGLAFHTVPTMAYAPTAPGSTWASSRTTC